MFGGRCCHVFVEHRRQYVIHAAVESPGDRESSEHLLSIRSDSHWRCRSRSGIDSVVGYLEQFAQQTFAEETERITGGAAAWQDSPEIRLEKVQPDGLLMIHQPRPLEHLPRRGRRRSPMAR
jgi:hypothetical protein